MPIRLNVFYGGGNFNLIENWFDGNNWNVTDHGQPTGTGVDFAPGAEWRGLLPLESGCRCIWQQLVELTFPTR